VREQAISAPRVADGRAGLDRDEAFDLVEDREGDELRSREGLLVREAKNLDAGGSERGISLCVIPEAILVSVLGTVDLDGEPQEGAEEVESVGPCSRLAPELGAEVAVPEDEPDSGFGVGRGHALEAAEIDRG
jgi:hypothetical protein